MKIRIFLAAIVSAFALSANSATLVISDSTGQLTGATHVVVDGAFYDVSFLEGTCNAVYNGCNDFTFTTLAGATLASYALLDQVFIDRDDTVPSLTFGIDVDIGHIATPFGPRTGGTLDIVTAVNYPSTILDIVQSEIIAGFASTGSVDSHVFAVWAPSAVPLPAAGWLFCSALIVLSLQSPSQRHRKSTTRLAGC